MQDIYVRSVNERAKNAYIFIIGLITLSAFTIILLGTKGLILAMLGILGLIMTLFTLKKPSLLLFLALFIYPLTRILSLDDKFIITGGLYALAMPCTFWLIKKKFGSVSNNSLYLWAMVMYAAVLLMNYFRPQGDVVEMAKEFGRMYFAFFTILAVHYYSEQKENNIWKLTKYISYLFNAMAIIGIGQYITRTGGMMHEGFYRIRGTFFNFNEYGYAISLFICFALYVLLTTQKHRFYWISSIVLNLFALAATFSKTSIINTVLIFFIMSLFLPWRRKLQLLASSIVIGSLMTFYMIATGIFNALVLRFADTSSLEWRYQMWNRMYHMILQGDVLFGQGLAASRNFLALLVHSGSSNAPHNIYLETTYNFGLVGLIPFALIFILILMQGVSIFADRKMPENKLIGTSVLIITTITILQNYVSNAFYDRAANIMFWAMLTVLICQYRQLKER